MRASLGIAFNRPSDDLLRNPDIALYCAKRASGSQYTIHDEDHIYTHIGMDELRATCS